MSKLKVRFMSLFIVVGLFYTHHAVAAPASQNGPSAANELGGGLLDGLLEDLDGKLPELAEPSQLKPSVPPTPPKPPSWLPKPGEIERNIQRQIGGEDVGQKESPLAPIARSMSIAAELISQNQTANPPRPVQEQVVTDLEMLIEKLEKECNSCNNSSNQPKNQKKQASKRSEPKPGECKNPSEAKQAGAPKPSKSQSAAQTSTTRMGSAEAVDPNGQSNEELMKAAWGHLPPRIREQMIHSSSEEFLPEYREQLKEYFKRLAEREAEEETE